MTPTPSPQAPLVSDRVYGAIAVLLILLAGYFALRGGPPDGGGEDVPALTVLDVEPDRSGGGLRLVFDAGVELRPAAVGWTSGTRHVHLRLGGAELMPGAGDVQHLQGTRYAWRIPRLPPGRHALRLFWSDLAHRPLPDGASPVVTLELPEAGPNSLPGRTLTSSPPVR